MEEKNSTFGKVIVVILAQAEFPFVILRVSLDDGAIWLVTK
jgi:hypothetical protein